LVFSESGAPEYFSSLSYFEIGAASDGEITALVSSHSRLFIFKEYAIYYLQGDTISNFFVDYMSRDIGCVSPGSTVVVDTGVFEGVFFASTDGIFVLNVRSGEVGIVSEKIKNYYLDSLNHAQRDKWISVHNRTYDSYILFCTSSGSTQNDIALVYNYRVKAWSIWDLHADCAGEVFSNSSDLYTGSLSGSTYNIFQQNSGSSDGGSSYSDSVLDFGSDWFIGSDTYTPNSLIGLPVYLFDPRSLVYQSRVVIANDSSKVTVDSAFSPSIGIHYEYHIGGIPLDCETGWLSFENPQREKRYESVDFIFDPTVATSPLLAVSYLDFSSSLSKRRMVDLSSTSGHKRWSPANRARHFKLRLLNFDSPVELRSLLYGFELKAVR